MGGAYGALESRVKHGNDGGELISPVRSSGLACCFAWRQ